MVGLGAAWWFLLSAWEALAGGEGAKRDAPRGLPAPPAASAPGAGPAALSETDVGEVLGWPVEKVAGPGLGRPAAWFRGGGVNLGLTLRKRNAGDPGGARIFGPALALIRERARASSAQTTTHLCS